MKPSDPSEPLFPIRPMEPACQYFLKHGTCKFGQACKFNHPRGTLLTGGCGGPPSGQMVFVTTDPSQGAMRSDASSHLVNGSATGQALPQRPTEPNCIYFLRNGSCKYGATCKFHHPVDVMNRSNQVHHQPNMRPSLNAKDRPSSAGSLPDSRPNVQPQHNVDYAPASNVSYVQQPRLQPITERVRPQQLTHILLPDGQIAVILDPKSLQNVSELNAQDRPKFYLSQTGSQPQMNGSIGTLQSTDHIKNPMVSPMLTATTNSTSNHTFDSSIDLMGTHVSYQGQPQDSQSQGPDKSSSGGSLSAYGSVDSGSHLLSEYSQQGSGHPQQMPSNQSPASFPQYASWSMNEGVSQSNQVQVRRSTDNANALDRQRNVADFEGSSEYADSNYWPSSGSFSSSNVNDRDMQGARSYVPMPHPSSNPSSYNLSSNHDGHTLHHVYPERNTSKSPSASPKQMHGRQNYRQVSSGEDEGLTMMTSALLTMMDRHESVSTGNNSGSGHNHSPLHNTHYNAKNSAYGSRSEPKLSQRAGHARLPPGIEGAPPGMYCDQNLANTKFTPGGGGYFIGGYDQQNTTPPPWGE